MATTEAAAAAGEATQKGMPQLNFATWPNQIFWLLVALAIIYVVLTRVALPRIAAILAERKGTIGNDIAAAEELKSRAKAAEAAYNLALEQARIEAGKIIATTKAEIQTGLNAAIGTADAAISVKSAEGAARIADIRAGAMAAVAEVARDTAGALVSALGGNADAGTIEAAVTARLKG